MVGAIEYLRAVRRVCEEAKGRCKNCPLGSAERVDDTICPRLTDPRTWSDGKTTKMAFK